MPANIMLFACDGHIIESIVEMVPFLDAVDLDVALAPPRNRARRVLLTLPTIPMRSVRSPPSR